jgi:hypothetical protein
MPEDPDEDIEMVDGDDDDSTYAPSDDESDFDDDTDDDESYGEEESDNGAPVIPEPAYQDQHQVPGVIPGVMAEDPDPDGNAERQFVAAERQFVDAANAERQFVDAERQFVDAGNAERQFVAAERQFVANPGLNIIENDNAEGEIDADDMDRYAAMDQFHANMVNDEIIFGQGEEVIFENDDDDEDGIDGEIIAPPIDPTAAMDQRYGNRQHNYGLRPRKLRDYGHMHTMTHGTDPVLHETMMTQYSLKKGMQMFGDRAVKAVLSELRQLHDRKVMIPVMAHELTYEQRKAALAYLMFLKEKRCGTVKGRGYADGRKQRLYTPKAESSSPTVSNEALYISCTKDAEEKRDVATADFPGAFMHAFMDELVHMRLEGTMVDLVCQLDPDLYTKYVTMEGNKKVLYVILNKALYGTLRAALLFWRKLTDELKNGALPSILMIAVWRIRL